ncbi:SRPBCC domain-containing protein [Vibrio quintilis]|uniref:Polyketide cyclase / dehydrase and lipid transport n=1 Tax=Vibrio quintilis TaxID=1117707 RepID=A0A1M7Z2U9_9VIBR|nr:SRPBCC domain-containing protein [Vibrio quintilis]SHO59164.1 hypothetical protein VQ7734_04944 [Vibrio quintilis]
MISKVIEVAEDHLSNEKNVSVVPAFFQRCLETTIFIDEVPEAVYARISHLKSYCQWSPLIRSIDGDLKPGCRLNIKIELKEVGTMKIRPTVVNLERNRELRWIGHLWFKGLFDGEHYFTLEEDKNGQTKLYHGEKFSGLLVPLLWRIIRKGTIESFLAHNVALKQLVEMKG